jgi:hypothetical protein
MLVFQIVFVSVSFLLSIQYFILKCVIAPEECLKASMESNDGKDLERQ